MGLRLKGDSMRIERLKDWVPVWAPLVHARLRRLSLAFSGLGVVMVGRRGGFAPLDIGTELVVASQYAADGRPDQRKCCVRSSPRRSGTTIWTLHFAIFFGASAALLVGQRALLASL